MAVDVAVALAGWNKNATKTQEAGTKIPETRINMGSICKGWNQYGTHIEEAGTKQLESKRRRYGDIAQTHVSRRQGRLLFPQYPRAHKVWGVREK